MKPLSFSLLQTFERVVVRAALAIVFLVFTLSAVAQERSTRQATDAEVAAGADVKAYINPLQFKNGGGGGGGGSNGITQLDYQHGIQSGTNIFRGSNINVTQINSSGMVLTNALTNLTATASTAAGFDANKKLVSIANALGVLTWSGSGAPAFAIAPIIDLSNATNLLSGNAVLPGANINIAATRRTDGGSNYTASLADPASLNQGNFVNIAVTNFYMRTNDMTGVTVVDFATGSEATYDGLASSLTITGFQNAVAGVNNEKIIKVHASGNQTVGWPASWWLAPSVTGTATNLDWTYYWVDMQAGHYTNVFEVYTHH